MNNELEINGRKRSWNNLRLYTCIYLERLKKTTKISIKKPVSRPKFEHGTSNMKNLILKKWEN
jgi:hypothetical protein